jgi:DNA-binding response OmpR family regulator
MPVPLRSNDRVFSSLGDSLQSDPALAELKMIPSSDVSLRPTVLVADDSDDTREMFRTLLGMKGYRVLEARDGHEAIDVTVRENPGLVLLDLGLPLLNGLSVIRRLRTELKIVSVPVVVITGFDKHFETAMAAGCDDYLLKPVDFDRLDTILDYYVPTKARVTSA